MRNYSTVPNSWFLAEAEKLESATINRDKTPRAVELFWQAGLVIFIPLALALIADFWLA